MTLLPEHRSGHLIQHITDVIKTREYDTTPET